MPTKIKWPKSNKPVNTKKGQFVAMGRTGGTIAGLKWTCKSVANPGAVVQSKLIPAVGGGGGQQRWAIGFKVPAAGQYDLEVVSDDKSSDQIRFDVNFTRGAAISWPDPGDITDYADDFCPYGPLTTNQIGRVTLTDQNGNQVPLLVPAWGDPSTLELWVAQFDAVPHGKTYSLHAEDTTGVGGDCNNLTVQP